VQHVIEEWAKNGTDLKPYEPGATSVDA
jgi:hypothetical protein